jgi:hypothetical protein
MLQTSVCLSGVARLEQKKSGSELAGQRCDDINSVQARYGPERLNPQIWFQISMQLLGQPFSQYMKFLDLKEVPIMC